MIALVLVFIGLGFGALLTFIILIGEYKNLKDIKEMPYDEYKAIDEYIKSLEINID